ncbi:MAG TPA: CoA-binding protein [Nocardioidaceae bacterium]|nr:CoA-binding protein [Nocardioidaceae bacterium]
MDNRWGDDEAIRWILDECQTWAVVGLGDDPFRPAYGVARFLQQHGKQVVPVHPQGRPVLGEPAFTDLEAIDFDVDCVDVFRRSDQAGLHADQAVRIGARAVWFQLGVIDEEAYRRTTAAGVEMIMNRCPVIEWPRLGPSA